MMRPSTPPRTSIRQSHHASSSTIFTAPLYETPMTPSSYNAPFSQHNSRNEQGIFLNTTGLMDHKLSPYKPSSPTASVVMNPSVTHSPLRYARPSQAGTHSPMHYNATQSGISTHHRPTSAPQFIERLSTEEMEKELEKMAIEIPPDFWKKPKAEDVQGLYSVALEEVFNLKKQEIRVEEITGEIMQTFPSYEGVQLLSYEGRLHLRAIGNLRFLRYCQRLCWHILGLPQFNRDYLFNPTPSTLLSFCTAFVNFLKFRQMIYSEHSDQFDDMNKKAEEDMRLDENIRMLRNDMNQFNSMLVQMQHEMKERRDKYDELLSKTNEASTKFNTSNQKLIAVKEEFDAASNQEKEVSLNLARTHMEIEKLKDQVAPSAENLLQKNKELQKQINEMVESIHQNEEFLKNCGEKLLLMEKSRKRLLRVEGMVTSQLEPQLQDLLVGRASVKSSKAELSDLKDEETKCMRQMDAMDVQLKKLSGVYKQKKDDWDRRVMEAQKMLRDSTRRLQERDDALKMQEEEIGGMNDSCDKLLNELKIMKERYASIVLQFEEMTMELLECRDVYLQKVEACKMEVPTLCDSTNEFVIDRYVDESKSMLEREEVEPLKKEVIAEMDENADPSFNSYSFSTNVGFNEKTIHSIVKY